MRADPEEAAADAVPETLHDWEKLLLQRLEDAQRDLMTADRALLRLTAQLQRTGAGDPGIERAIEKAKALHTAAYSRCRKALADFNSLVMHGQLPAG